VPPDNLPYFRTNNNVSRGQLSKMTALAFDWNHPVMRQWFQDVPPGSTFYNYVSQLYPRGIINGYPCGAPPAGPCVPPGNLPYFRPNNDVTRGQTAKIVQLARTQPTLTPTPVSSVTATETPNPDYQGVPPSQDMQITPGNCGPQGTTFTFLGSGFKPSENVHFWLTAPDGSVLGSPQPFPADNNGDVGPLPLTTDTSYPIGLWSLIVGSVTFQHQAIGYFMLLPAGYAPKQSH